MKLSQIYDIVIVGGGPAGTTAGYLLKKKGFNVIIIDKAKFPRFKLCGGGLTQKTVDLIQEIFGIDYKTLFRKKIIEYYSPKTVIYYKGISLNIYKKPTFFMRREIYDLFFLNLAREAGVDVVEEERVVRVDVENSIVFTEKGNAYKGKIIIGADGVTSIVRKEVLQYAGKNNFTHNYGISAEIFVTQAFLRRPIIEPHIYMEDDFKGYGWLFPNKNRLVIGIGSSFRKNIHTIFKRFIDSLGIEVKKKDVHIYPLLLSSFNSLYLGVEKVILIGEAAGMVSPLTGEGIFYAHKSGKIAAKAIIDALNSKKRVISVYNTYSKKEIYPKLYFDLFTKSLFLLLMHFFIFFPDKKKKDILEAFFELRKKLKKIGKV